jgi:hypothetical protein
MIVNLRKRDLSKGSPYANQYTWAIILDFATAYCLEYEIFDWCTEKFPPEKPNCNRWFYQHDIRWFVFSKQSDALLCFLSWQGHEIIEDDE